MKGFTITIKPKQTGLSNPLHLEVQQTTRMNIFKPKKGKGSYDRNKMKNIEY